MLYIASQGKLFQRALLLLSFGISKQLDMLYKLLKLAKTRISLAGADPGGGMHPSISQLQQCF